MLSSKIAATKGSSAKAVEGRDLEGFEYDKSKAKILKGALHSINVALGTIMSANKDISMIRGSEVTPDGKLGGKGFIMSFKDIKKILNDAILNLSDITDTIADELTNPQWGLSVQEKKKVKKEQESIDNLVEDSEDLDNTGPKESDYDSITPNNGDKEDTNLDDSENDSENVEESEDHYEQTENDSDKEITKESKESSEDSYKELLYKDKTAAALSRNIMANLLTGIRKNG